MDVDFLRYQFEDGYDGIIAKNKFRIGVRHIQLTYMVVASVVAGSVRGTVGVGVLAMTDPTRRNDTYVQVLEWDRRMQGTILSAFFFGYAVVLAPASLYLTRCSSKLVMTAVMAINGALFMAMPTIVNKGGWMLVCNAHLILGMTQACVCPAQAALTARWFAPAERRYIAPIVYGGLLLGVILALPITQIIAEFRLSWELVFYSQAMLCLSVAVVWFLLTSDSPGDHQAIGDNEKEFLEQAVSSYHKVHTKVPWRRILSSPQFWSVVCAHAASNAIFVFYLTEVPLLLKYFKGVAKETCFLPFVGLWVMNVMTSPSIDYLHRVGFVTYLINLTYYRKLINGLGACGVVIGLALLPHLLTSRGNLAIVVLVGVLALIGFQYSGFMENLKDMTERHRVAVVTAASAMAAVVAAAVPLGCGLLLAGEEMNIKRWRNVLMSLSSIYLLLNIIYTGFSSSDRQLWDFPSRKFGYHNGLLNADLELEELKQTKLSNEMKLENDTIL